MQYQVKKLANGLTVIGVPIPYLESVTTLIAVGVGSRYESKKNNGIAHFLEHMLFKGTKKYPTTEIISNLVDGMGAINNAFTDREYTSYWIKSPAKHLEKSLDILSSTIKESLIDPTEIEKEKGVIIEELRMYQDSPDRYIWDLYPLLQFGDIPLGRFIGGKEETVSQFTREDFIALLGNFYQPSNMILIFVGKIPTDFEILAKRYLGDLKDKKITSFTPVTTKPQKEAKVSTFFKTTDQAKLVLGVKAFSRKDPKRYATRVLTTILGDGMSSRLWSEIREKRGLAYYVGMHYEYFLDTAFVAAFAGLKLEKLDEGLKVIIEELEKVKERGVTDEELKRAKEMISGRLAIRSESSNFLAESYGLEYLLDKKIETIAEYIKKINQVTLMQVQDIAQELFLKEQLNLQLIGPFKDEDKFRKILR